MVGKMYAHSPASTIFISACVARGQWRYLLLNQAITWCEICFSMLNGFTRAVLICELCCWALPLSKFNSSLT